MQLKCWTERLISLHRLTAEQTDSTFSIRDCVWNPDSECVDVECDAHVACWMLMSSALFLWGSDTMRRESGRTWDEKLRWIWRCVLLLWRILSELKGCKRMEHIRILGGEAHTNGARIQWRPFWGWAELELPPKVPTDQRLRAGTLWRAYHSRDGQMSLSPFASSSARLVSSPSFGNGWRTSLLKTRPASLPSSEFRPCFDFSWILMPYHFYHKLSVFNRSLSATKLFIQSILILV